MRFALTRTDDEERRHPVEVENAGVPRPQLELVEFQQRMRDGTEFEVELSGGRVTLLVERRAGAIVRHVMPDEPPFLDIANLRRLFDSLPPDLSSEPAKTPSDSENQE
jgi:hypothetical protein